MKTILIAMLSALFIIMLYAITYFFTVNEYEFNEAVLTLGIIGITYTCTHIAFVMINQYFKEK